MLIRLLVWVSYIGLIYGEVQKKPLKFLMEPEDVYVEENQEGVLNCLFSVATPQCFWNKDGRIVEIANRYEFIGDPKQGNCSIRIKSKYALDNGKWKCGNVASSAEIGLSSKWAQFTVLVTPEDPIILINGTEMLKDSDLVVDNIDETPTIICMSNSSNPEANLKWNINGKYVAGKFTTNSTNVKMPISSLLFKSRIDNEWNGEKLMCISDHLTFGYNQQKMTYVNIRIPYLTRNVSVWTDMDDVIVDSDQLGASDQITFYCNADGYPLPSFYAWEIREDEDHDWQSFGKSQNITFQPISGQFSCLAWSKTDGLNKIRSEQIITITRPKSNSPSQPEMYYLILGLITALLLMFVCGISIVIFQRRGRINVKNCYWKSSKKSKQSVKCSTDALHKHFESLKRNAQFFADRQIVREVEPPQYEEPVSPKVPARDPANLINVPSGCSTIEESNTEPIYQEIIPGYVEIHLEN